MSRSNLHDCPGCVCGYGDSLDARRAQVCRGIIGDRRELFEKSPTFHYWVIQQAEVLVQHGDLIAGMAEAESRDTERRVFVEMNKLPPSAFYDTKELADLLDEIDKT